MRILIRPPPGSTIVWKACSLLIMILLPVLVTSCFGGPPNQRPAQDDAHEVCLPAVPVFVEQGTVDVMRDSASGCMGVGFAEVHRGALESVFPSADSWIVEAFRVWPPSRGVVDIGLDEGRLSDAGIISGALPVGPSPIDLLLAYRLTARPGWKNDSDGEIAIASCDGPRLHILARANPVSEMLPSARAVHEGLRDTSQDAVLGGSLNLRPGEWRRIHVVSWNGMYSTGLASVRRPDHVGT